MGNSGTVGLGEGIEAGVGVAVIVGVGVITGLTVNSFYQVPPL